MSVPQLLRGGGVPPEREPRAEVWGGGAAPQRAWPCIPGRGSGGEDGGRAAIGLWGRTVKG